MWPERGEFASAARNGQDRQAKQRGAKRHDRLMVRALADRATSGQRVKAGSSCDSSGHEPLVLLVVKACASQVPYLSSTTLQQIDVAYTDDISLFVGK